MEHHQVKGELAELREEFDSVMDRLHASKSLAEKESLLAELRAVLERTAALLDKRQKESFVKVKTSRKQP